MTKKVKLIKFGLYGLFFTVVLLSLIVGLSASYGHFNVARWSITLPIFVGGILMFMGYKRMIPEGDYIRVMVFLNLMYSVAFIMVGIRMLFVALFYAPPRPTAYEPVVVFFTHFPIALAAFMILCTGIYLYFGADRGWYVAHFLKNPFRKKVGK